MSVMKTVETKHPIRTYTDFWNWFLASEHRFYQIVKDQQHVEDKFLNVVFAKLNELQEGLFILAGMRDDHTAEFIVTADGEIKNIAFVEELISAAPAVDGWIFTPLKPSVHIDELGIEMEGLQFTPEKISFVYNENPAYPDEIDITVVHEDFTDENQDLIISGVHLFLEIYLGELEYATLIDSISVGSPADVQQDLIPIIKLKDFLVWRQKEFVEKYEATRYDTENDSYLGYEAELEDGNPLVAIINEDLLKWEPKASHPWIVIAEIIYDGSVTNGMPDEKTYDLLEKIEEDLMQDLKDYEGYLYIGRETADDTREIYFACKDFRKPSMVLRKLKQNYSDRLEINSHIYKDKYWQTFERFTTSL